MIKKIFGSMHPFIEGGDIYGRIVANTNYILALFNSDIFDEYHFFLNDKTSFKKQLETISFKNLNIIEKIKVFTRQELPSKIKENNYYCFHFSDPFSGFNELYQVRNHLSKSIFPITSLTHSLSYQNYGLFFSNHINNCVSSRDAIVASSNAAQKVIKNYFELLHKNWNLPSNFSYPNIPIIPLGINIDTFTEINDGEKLNAKKKLCHLTKNITDNTVLILSHGRLSLDDKMDILPLIQALSRVKELTNKKFHLILSGRNRKDDNYPKAIKKMAELNNISYSIIDSPDNELMQNLFFASDIFVSISDNLQESFGLSLLEASLASLPSITSNWNGYRDIIIHEKTGFLIPTYNLNKTPYLDLIGPILPDNINQLFRAQSTVIDVKKLADALLLLIENQDLRKKLGDNARKHIHSNFTWPNIIQKWENLWQELWDKKIDVEKLKTNYHLNFISQNLLFKNHASNILNDNSTIKTSIYGEKVRSKKAVIFFWPDLSIYINEKDIHKLLVLARQNISIKELKNRLITNETTEEKINYLIYWALKEDLIEIIEYSN